MKTKFLGKNTLDKNLKGKYLLDEIKRGKSSIKYGYDIWNVYDFLYLDDMKMPKLKILEITIPASSLFTVESKSMKLYLNEFYKKSFKRDADVLKKIKKDIEEVTKSSIKINFINKFYDEPTNTILNNSRLVNSKPNTVLKFNGFRSICPVTSQPDLANIYIYSNKGLSIEWLKQYLFSYQDQGDFHEQCVESIYLDIMDQFACTGLEISGRFQRRGGIDINPFRGTSKKYLNKNFREFNQ
tara:strand:+ start:543 stop:1265 length:723 start_codon:yes stop_codon:yes gene_type:complete